MIQVFAAGDSSTEETACNSLIMTACSDDAVDCSASGRHARICVTGLTPGDTYYVMVAAKTAAVKGLYQLDIRSPCFEGPIWISDDCNGNGLADGCELGRGSAMDCNENHVLDECDLATGMSFDCDGNAIPDECELLPPFDFDFDGDVDLLDLAWFQRCFTGSGLGTVSACCRAFDQEPDGDADLDDFGIFLGHFSGP